MWYRRYPSSSREKDFVKYIYKRPGSPAGCMQWHNLPLGAWTMRLPRVGWRSAKYRASMASFTTQFAHLRFLDCLIGLAYGRVESRKDREHWQQDLAAQFGCARLGGPKRGTVRTKLGRTAVARNSVPVASQHARLQRQLVAAECNKGSTVE